MRPIVIAAGGTGGHIFPAEALAAELVARGRRIVLITDSRSASLQSPVFAGKEQYVIRGAGLAGRGMPRAGAAMLSLLAGTVQARQILGMIDAAAVVGFGGYPSVAPVLATRFTLRRPAVVLHEQNAVLGRANRFLAKRADRVALSFAATTRAPAHAPTSVTGNPVRRAIASLEHAGYAAPTEKVRVLVLGGSLGARVFSDVVPTALRQLPESLRAQLVVTQQCRTEDLPQVRSAYDETGINADLAAFFPNVAARLVAAHLVIARAGASTVAELAVSGRPAILVPLPGAIDDHQSANARALADAGGAWVMPQSTFTPDALSARLIELFTNPAALARAAVGARSVAQPHAAARLADLVEELTPQEAMRP